MEQLRRLHGGGGRGVGIVGGVGLDGWMACLWHRGCCSPWDEYSSFPVLEFLPELCRHMFMVPGHLVWPAGKC